MTATLAASLLAATVLAAPSFAQNACVGENCPAAPAAPQASEAPAAPRAGQQPVNEQVPVIRQGEAAPEAGEQMQSAEPGMKPAEKPAAEATAPEDDTEDQAAAPKEGKDAQAAAPKPEDGEQSAEAEISTEEKAEIRSEIRDRGKFERQRVDIDINIGVGIPQAVVLQPLPATVVTLVPAYQGYLFFVMADGTIVIVDPDTRQVVYLIA